jgi:hypothetical protein
MRLSRVVGISLSVILPLPSASAQSDSVSTSTNETPKWEFSLGVDPTQLDLRTRDAGVDLRMVGTLTRNWQRPGSRFSRQLSLMVGADAPRVSSSPEFACYGCWDRAAKQYVGLTAGASADLFRAWGFVPYLHTGAGAYYTRLRGRFSTVDFSPATSFARNDFSFGVNAGFGIKKRLLSHEFFIDQTLHAFDASTLDRGVYPLSVGIRW